jgi:MOSC domain-containing protein YiiM
MKKNVVNVVVVATMASLVFVIAGVSAFRSTAVLSLTTTRSNTTTTTCPLYATPVVPNPEEPTTSTTMMTQGTVLRTAFRKYHPKDSKPSSRKYTTRKDSQDEGIQIRFHGIVHDYNDYRTTAKNSTLDRAVSLWTTDVLELLQAYGYDQVQPGDLGENLSVEDIPYTFFQVGQRYRFFSPPAMDDDEAKEDAVVLEITERIEPCGSLCVLPYINSDTLLQPKERVKRCQDFLKLLDQHDGLRGWYAKVLREGTIRPGNIVVKVEDPKEEEEEESAMTRS